MNSHLELTDQKFLHSFELGDLHPSLFNHEAHLRLAYLHLTNFSIDQAIENVTSQIQEYVIKWGAESKYNHTLTIAAVYAVNHFMKKANAASFNDLLRAFPVLLTNFKDLMDSHYGFDIFQSSEAKRVYIAPDLQPFI